ncbi:MAG: alkaline phosphatase family protein [Polyangiaceae bacterium]
MKTSKTIASVAAALTAFSVVGSALGAEGNVPRGVPHLDHVFVIMMENHGYNQIIGNPSAPFMNLYAKRVNLATNYYAVAHPSLTNYLEIVGGSNFGVLNDNSPDWHNATCTTNLALGTPSLDNGTFPNICPIQGTGTDAATPVFDNSNETSPPAITSVTEIDGKLSIPAASGTSGKTIADQLTEAGLGWKSYQESVSYGGADLVNYSDGYFDNNSDVPTILAGSGATSSNIVHLYAAKHDPFVYFQSVQQSGLQRIVGFEGARGLFDDLQSGNVPEYSFIVPNQCNDQHGQNNATAACFEDPNDNGTLVGINPGLIYQGDLALRSLVKAIHDSPTWPNGNNAIIIVWDENDYSAAPYPNRVVLTVDTSYGAHGVQSDRFYTHFSLLKSVEAGLHLPCLNHACDDSVKTMSDLFASPDWH